MIAWQGGVSRKSSHEEKLSVLNSSLADSFVLCFDVLPSHYIDFPFSSAPMHASPRSLRRSRKPRRDIGIIRTSVECHDPT